MQRIPQTPPAGIFRGATPSSSAGRWYDCNNIRFRQGMAQPIGGYAQLPSAIAPDTIRDLVTWHDNNAVRWAAYGSDTKLYAYRFDTKLIYDITPTGVGALDPPGARAGWGLGDYGEETYGTARDSSNIGIQDIGATMGDRWVMDTFGQDLLVVPTQDGRLYTWSPTTPATRAALVAEAPTNNQGVIVTDQRHVVLYGAGNDPRRVAWSDQENYHVWTADVTNLAGDKRLATQSYAMTAIKVSQGILIWTANDLHLMTYVGPPYAYGISMIAAGCGPMSPRAIVQVGNNVLWPGLQTFWGFSGSVQTLPSDIGDWFFSLVNRQQLGRVFGSPNPTFSEAWWDWPDEGSIECNRYIMVNYSDQGRPWAIGVRNRTAADPTGTMDYPVLAGPKSNTDPKGYLWLHEYGMTADGTPRGPNGLIYLESGAIGLGEGDQRFHVRQLVLDAVAPGDDLSNDEHVIGWRFLYKEQPQHPVEYDTGLYTQRHDGLMDIRFSCRTMRARIEALSDDMWAIGRPRLVIRPGGKR